VIRNPVHVAAGIVLRDGWVFLTKRAADVHQGGKWEFPGGKVQLNESSTQALGRELKEEVGLTIARPQLFMCIEHDYCAKKIILDFYLVTEFDGEPKGCEGQLFKWFEIDELVSLDFPEANSAVIEKLINQR
jgi:8-oxo-dGTP diphosphatase